MGRDLRAPKVGSLWDDVRLKIATNYAGQTRPHFWVVSERKKAERVNKKRKRDLEAASSSNDLESQEIVEGMRARSDGDGVDKNSYKS